MGHGDCDGCGGEAVGARQGVGTRCVETVVGVAVRLWVQDGESARGVETADGAMFSVMVFNA